MGFVSRLFIYGVVFIVSLVVFLPKINLYYFAVNQLETYKIEASHDVIEDKFYGLNILDLNIFYDGIDVVKIKETQFDIFLLFNEINLKNVKLDKSLSNYSPSNIDFINLKFSILDPLNILIEAKIENGSVIGKIDLIEKVLKLDIYVSKSFKKDYKDLTRFLKYDKEASNKEEDRYSYEYKLQ